MNKQQAIQSLSNNKAVLTQRFGVTRLALFGSTARNAATDDSDVDILVSFMAQPHRNAILACSFIWKICSAALSI